MQMLKLDKIFAQDSFLDISKRKNSKTFFRKTWKFGLFLPFSENFSRGNMYFFQPNQFLIAKD
jgi:hypothetical protein